MGSVVAGTVGVNVAVGGTRVGVAVIDGVKLDVNVGVAVAVGGISVGVLDGVIGNSDGVSLDVGSAVNTCGLGPGVAMLAAVDVIETVSIAGEVVNSDELHAVKANTAIKLQRFNPVIKYLIPFILQPYFFLAQFKTNKLG